MRKPISGALRTKRGRGRANNNVGVADFGPRNAEKVSWTGRERLRVIWYLLRLDFNDYHYASRRMMELRLGLPPSPPYRQRRSTAAEPRAARRT